MTECTETPDGDKTKSGGSLLSEFTGLVMPVCTYDNPMTMMRECWQGGKLQAAYSAELYALKKWPIPAHLYHMGANIGDWKTGQIVGDKAAIGIKA